VTAIWQGLFATYQSLTDWIKALWLIVPPAFILILTALLLRAKRPLPETDGELVYTVHREASGQYRVLRHASSDDTPALLPLDQTHPALTPPERRA
jgi:NADH:ubiquinone oxidoreductase subunit H